MAEVWVERVDGTREQVLFDELTNGSIVNMRTLDGGPVNLSTDDRIVVHSELAPNLRIGDRFRTSIEPPVE
jgi:hypothetical protein